MYGLNPKQVARFKERYNLSGAKSDAADAHALADMVRTERHQLRPVAADTPEAEAIKVAARAHQTLIWERTRRRVLGTPAQTCTQLRQAGRLPRRVIVTGQAVHAAAGDVTAPVTGERCVACSVIVTTMVQGSNNVYPHPIYRREALDQVGINDTGGGPATILLTRRLLDHALPGDAARETTSTHHEFFPMAADTWPGGSYLARLRADGLIANRWLRRKGSEGFWVDEEVLRAGTQLVAIGRRARRGGDIVLDRCRGDVKGVAAATLDEVKQRYAAKQTRWSSWLRRVLLFGGIILSLCVTAFALT